MAKKEKHLDLNELKDIIKRQVYETYLGAYEQSGYCEYEPGLNVKLTEEEFSELKQYMEPKYSVYFRTENSGGDGWNTPNEDYIIPDNNDVKAIRSDINSIQNEHLRNEISSEFEKWLDNCEPDMDYNEMNESSVMDSEWGFRNPYQSEPGDEHFDDAEQIERDKENAWFDFENKKGMRQYEPSFYDNYNNNVEGEEMKPIQYSTGEKSEKYFGYPGPGSYKSMVAQSDEPTDKWYGQTSRYTRDESQRASDSWFPADIDDTQYSDSNYKVDKFGDINESAVKRYFRKIVREALEGMNNQQFVIQTRTGGYLIDIQDDSVSYDDETLILSCLVGRSPVSVMVDKIAYQNLINGGQSCDARYRVLAKGGESTPENPCTLSVYNG